MKMSNKEKDYLSIIVIAIIFGALIWLLTGAVFYVSSLFAEEKLTDIEKANKYYAEEQVKAEMRYLAMKDFIENMSEEEFVEVFYKDEIENKL